MPVTASGRPPCQDGRVDDGNGHNWVSPSIARKTPTSPKGLSRRVMMTVPRAKALRPFCRIDLQPPDVEGRVLPAVDRLFISALRRLQKTAPEPEFQSQIVNRLETIRDGETQFVNVALRHGDSPEFWLSGCALPCRGFEISFNPAGRVSKEETVNQVIAGVTNGVEKDPRLCALIPNPAIVSRLEILLQ